MVSGEEYQAKLLKEALKRASESQRLQYTQIQQQKTTLTQKLAQIALAQQALNERDRLNALPVYTPSSTDAKGGRQAREKAETAAIQKYKEALKVYRSQNDAVLHERMNLMQQVLAITAQLDELEKTEKWLLLEMAIRNQASLLGYMQSNSLTNEEGTTV